MSVSTAARPSAPARVARRVLRPLDAVERLLMLVLGPRAFWTRGSRTTHVVAGWIATRTAMVLVYWFAQNVVGMDVEYYRTHLENDGGAWQVTGVLREYPVPAVWLVAIPWFFVGAASTPYLIGFVALMLAVDAAFTWLVSRRDPDGRATTFWLAAGVMVGPLMITRFDLVPGVAVALGVALLWHRPRVAAALVTVAAAIKLWPALVLPLMAGGRRVRRDVLVTAVAVGAAIGVLMLVSGGMDRVLSPLHYQSERGLQIESLPAMPLMVMWAVSHDPWSVAFSPFICEQVYGPGESLMGTVSTIATLALAGLVALLTYRLWRRGGHVSTASIGWSVLATVSGLIVTNKVFSPQYLLWLLPLAVVLVALTGDRTARRVATTLLLVGVLDQVIFPGVYPWITDAGDHNLSGVALLALRNLTMLVVTVVAVRRALVETGPHDDDERVLEVDLTRTADELTD